VHANVWNVPVDAPTIQAGIDSAIAGDVVRVANGVYTGPGNRDIDFSGKAITVESQSGDPTMCVIDCGGSLAGDNRGFHFHSGEDSLSVLRNITITRAYHSWIGAGVLCENNSSPTIVGCVMHADTAWSGSGIYCMSSSSPTIRNCEFYDNFTEDGGGINCRESSSPKVYDCAIYDNEAIEGGGIKCSFSSDPTFRRCVIRGNLANSSGGGGVYCFRSSPTFIESVFIENAAPSDYYDPDGGAVYCYESSPMFRKCTFYGNSGQSVGGIVCAYSSVPVLENCIISFSGEGQAVGCDGTSSAMLSCVDVYGNVDGDWTDCIADQYGVDGNFSGHPLFCDAPSGDFALAANSPCLTGNHPDEYDCGLIGAFGQGCGIIGVHDWEATRSTVELFVTPNPFRRSVSVSYQVDHENMALMVFDVGGRLVRRYASDVASGVIVWDATTFSGARVAPGTYFLQLVAKGGTQTRRVVLLQ